MKKHNVIIGAVVLAASSFTANATLTSVGGVTWDPDAGAPLPDLSMDYFFYQAFTSAANAITNATNNVPLLTTIDPSSIVVGNVLNGFGEVDSMNGNSADINSLTGGPLCPDCELTLTFGGFAITSFLNGAPIFSDGWINFYVDDTRLYPDRCWYCYSR